MSFGEGDVFSFFYLPSLLLPPSPPVFSQKSGQFCTRYNGTRSRGRCKFRNVGSLATCSRCIPAVFSRHPNRRRALSRVVGLSAFAWMRYLCIGLFSATLPLCRSLSVQPPARPPHPSLSRAHYLSRSSVLSPLPPRITANNECIRNPTFLCPSVARFFVS